MTDTLIQRLSDEADLCRNDGATDVAKLLDDAVYALVNQAARLAAAEIVSAQPAAPAYIEGVNIDRLKESLSFLGAAYDSDEMLAARMAEHINRLTQCVMASKVLLADAAPSVAPEPVAWEGGEGWESLAWELCADENGEDACNELIWEGGPIPEPWGDRWMKYEGEAKRLIALVHKHAAHPPRAPQAPMTEEQRRDLVKECGLDWQRGFMPLFDGDPTNRYAVLIEAVEAAHGIGGK